MFDIVYLFRGLGMLMQPGLKRYVLVPTLISALILAGLIWIATLQFEVFMNWALPAEDSWLYWLRWLLWPLFALTFMLLVFYTFTTIANLVGAPFNSRLSEIVSRRLNNDLSELPALPLLKDILQSMASELKKLSYYLLRAIPLLILMLFPLTSAIASLLWLLFTIWFLALEYIAYPLENRQLRFQEQKSWLGKRPLSAMSFGGGVFVLMLIPLINLLVMPAAVIGATMLWHDKSK